MNASRRQLLRAASGLAAALPGARAPLSLGLAGLAALAAQSSRAANTGGGYRALVCLFMNGGSDSHNWVLPIDATGYAQYAAARGDLAWPTARLQAIASTRQAAGRAFGMPVELQPLRNWYEAGRAAVLANVGPLLRPVTKAEFQAGSGLPPKLFSHNDQQSTWQSLYPEGAASGWGGRMGDLLMAANAYPVFTALSASGNAIFLSGSQVTQYQVSGDGPVAVKGLSANWMFGSNTLKPILQRVVTRGGQSDFDSEYGRVMQRSIDTAATLQTALSAVSVPALATTAVTLGAAPAITPANESLAKQLRLVARLIGAGQQLGMQRQVFMVSLGGFDTHNNQMSQQPALMARVALSVDYFLGALQSLGLLNNVLLFTASDFGRTLVSNGDGSDHGWGSHHFVAGGAVKGRDIYGTFPLTATGTADDVGSGRLLPSTSVTQLAATLGGWLGLSASEQATVLPGLGNFPSAALGMV
ncbi:MAG: DUF1501 domain-containing protein [Proteobacteria bacterium]|nr:DUF1501 domain-containing protein [Pseudomonadota bacterium]